jgi:hypothetical protein
VEITLTPYGVALPVPWLVCQIMDEARHVPTAGRFRKSRTG